MTTTIPEVVIPDGYDSATEPGLVPYHMVVVPDDNVRKDLGDIDSLRESIAEEGLLTSPTVRPVNGHFELVAGYRRWTAIGQLIADDRWLGDVPVMFEAPTSDADRAIRHLVENLVREDLNPMDEADGITALSVQYGIGVDDIARRLGRSTDWVKDRLALAALIPAAAERVRQGTIPIAAGVAIGKETPALQEKLIQRKAVQSAKGEYATTTIRSELADIKNRAYEKAVKAKIKSLAPSAKLITGTIPYNERNVWLAQGSIQVTDPDRIDFGMVVPDLVIWSKDFYKQAGVIGLYVRQTEEALAKQADEADAAERDRQAMLAERQAAEAEAEAAKIREVAAQHPELGVWMEALRQRDLVVQEVNRAELERRPVVYAQLAATAETKDVAAFALRRLVTEVSYSLWLLQRENRQATVWAYLGLPADATFASDQALREHLLSTATLTKRAAAYKWAVEQRHLVAAAMNADVPELPATPDVLVPFIDPDELVDCYEEAAYVVDAFLAGELEPLGVADENDGQADDVEESDDEA